MFTGIVEEVGRVVSYRDPVITLEGKATLKGAKVGDSIAVNGVCLTITTLRRDRFNVDVSPETRRRTSLGSLKPSSPVNLERPLAYGGRLGGHLVEGHVDGIGKVLSIQPEQESFLLTVEAPRRLRRYIVEKGYIAVDGVSLTVVKDGPSRFSVAVIPYTYRHTVLGSYRPGDPVNLEVDILAKYLERLVASRIPHRARREKPHKASSST